MMIGKRLALELSLSAIDFEPSPFTIVTTVGSIDRAIRYTRQPLQLIFCFRSGPPYSQLSYNVELLVPPTIIFWLITMYYTLLVFVSIIRRRRHGLEHVGLPMMAGRISYLLHLQQSP